jgi:hypothetical protein
VIEPPEPDVELVVDPPQSLGVWADHALVFDRLDAAVATYAQASFDRKLGGPGEDEIQADQ